MFKLMWSSFMGLLIHVCDNRVAHEKAWIAEVKKLHKNKVNRRFLVD